MRSVPAGQVARIDGDGRATPVCGRSQPMILGAEQILPPRRAVMMVIECLDGYLPLTVTFLRPTVPVVVAVARLPHTSGIRAKGHGEMGLNVTESNVCLFNVSLFWK